MRGSVIDLAIGIIIGGAFQKIVSSLVGDVAFPLLGLATGGVDFTTLMLGPVAIGNFLQASIDFLIIAFFVFLLVKGINSLRKQKAEPEHLSRQEELLTEIRDLLKK